VLQIAQHGWRDVAAANPGVAEGVNLDAGRVTNQAVAATFGLPYSHWYAPAGAGAMP
jgi:alanine dehydrogenase